MLCVAKHCLFQIRLVCRLGKTKPNPIQSNPTSPPSPPLACDEAVVGGGGLWWPRHQARLSGHHRTKHQVEWDCWSTAWKQEERPTYLATALLSLVLLVVPGGSQDAGRRVWRFSSGGSARASLRPHRSAGARPPQARQEEVPPRLALLRQQGRPHSYKYKNKYKRINNI